MTNEGDYTPFVLGINGSTDTHGNSARNLRKTLSYVEKMGGKTKLIHLLDLDIFPHAEYCESKQMARRSNIADILIGLREQFLIDDPSERARRRLRRLPYVNEDTMLLYDLLLASDGFILAFSVHEHLPASPTVAFMEKIDALENQGNLLEGKVFGLIDNYGLEESGVCDALLGRLTGMGLIAPAYPVVYCSILSNFVNKNLLLERLLWMTSEKIRLEADGFSWRLEALARNLITTIKMVRQYGVHKPGSWK